MRIDKVLQLPSPYLFTPIDVPLNPLGMVMSALYAIDDPDNPYWETQIGSVFLLYRRCVITHFWRTGFDSKFVGVRMPRQPKETRQLIVAETELWHSVLRLLERMQTLCFLWECSAKLLEQIISEQALVMINFKYVEEGEFGATNYIKQLQLQNRILQGLENPFALSECPTAYRIIQRALELGNLLDDFRKEYYMKVVRNRMKLVTCLINQKARSYNQKKVLRQGRKRAAR